MGIKLKCRFEFDNDAQMWRAVEYIENNYPGMVGDEYHESEFNYNIAYKGARAFIEFNDTAIIELWAEMVSEMENYINAIEKKA